MGRRYAAWGCVVGALPRLAAGFAPLALPFPLHPGLHSVAADAALDRDSTRKIARDAFIIATINTENFSSRTARKKGEEEGCICSETSAGVKLADVRSSP